jgi:hypothetical protein
MSKPDKRKSKVHHPHPTTHHDHTTRTLFSRPDRLADPLYVVAPIFNSVRFRSRWRLYEDFCKMVANSGAILYTAEVAFGDREFVVTDDDNPRHVQMRTYHEIWLKERMINLIVQRLPMDWKYVAWVDADVVFARHDWADETKHQLEHFPVVQMWSQLHDLNANNELVGTNRSFADMWVKGENPLVDEFGDYVPTSEAGTYPYLYKRGYPGAPGLAWAMRREAWDQLGGLIDYCILGAGDWYGAHAIAGTIEHVIPAGMSPTLARKLRDYQHRAAEARWHERAIMGNLGCVQGVVLHYYHGQKINRRYQTREKILYKAGFDPDYDLKEDAFGLYQLTNRVPQLRRDVQRYFRERNEDI